MTQRATKYTKRDIDGVVEILRDDIVIAIVINREEADTILQLLNDYLGGKGGYTKKGRRSTDRSDKN